MTEQIWDKTVDEKTVKKTMASLNKNGITTYFVKDAEAAKEKVLSIIPPGAEVMTMTSVTLDSIGIPKEIQQSQNFESVRNKLVSMDRKKDNKQMQQMGAAPEWALGSVHAVTQDGTIIIASNTGSQLPAYAYGASHVIWVVGTQKIVQDFDSGINRLYDYVLSLENKRAMKAYGVGSAINKKLVLNKEVKEGRITLIFVDEVLGF